MQDDQLALAAGYERRYDYTQYSHENHVNVIPEEDFDKLVKDTFKTIADTLRKTYGPYASTVLISEMNEMSATKDGYNVFSALKFSQPYKQMVYRTIQKIIDDVNHNVGDGTTSCILLADKMYAEIKKTLNSPEDKRQILSVLTNLENYLKDRSYVETDTEDGIIKPLTKHALKRLINVADNYDDELAKIVYDALSPEFQSAPYADASDENDAEDNLIVSSMNNVVVNSFVTRDISCASTTYKIDHLPGDYRINCYILYEEMRWQYSEGMNVKVAVYDHKFGESDWNFFMDSYDLVTPTLIIARDFAKEFLDYTWTKWVNQRNGGVKSVKDRIVPMTFCQIKSNTLKDDIADLAAALGTSPIGMKSIAVDHDRLPLIHVQLYDHTIMCFDMKEIPTQYIDALKYEMDADIRNSMTINKLYRDRIRALENTANDTLVTINSASSLESKMIGDKVEDCLAIAASAMEYGIVPNLFAYGYNRIDTYRQTHEDDANVAAVTRAIMTAIKGLFEEIFRSKHGDQFAERCIAIEEDLYRKPDSSFDIKRETFTDIDEFPTSAQYDLEVLSATIEIVKYLLTSRACVFEGNLMKPIDDTGHYVPIGM
jgi:hypothetical protein